MIRKYLELITSTPNINKGENRKPLNNFVSDQKALISNTKVVILSKNSIENGAGGTRIQNLVKILSHDSSFAVSAYGFSEKKQFGEIIEKNDNNTIRCIGNYKGKKGIKKYKVIFYSKKVIKDILQRENPDIVVVYSTLTFRNISFLKKYTKKNNIKLFFDVVEYRPLLSSLSLSSFFGYNLHNNLISSYFINKKTDGVICPTHFLESHFVRKRNCANVFYLPITMDVASLPKYNKNPAIDRITFLYAGNPKKKRDLLSNIIKAFNLLDDSTKTKVLLVICGITPENIMKKEGLSKKEYKKSLSFTLYLGPISKPKLSSILPNIDYSLLLKNPKKRYSKAGFPTKMAESFACGIPMVCNLSGDMEFFVKDCFNGIVCNSTEPQDFCSSIKEAIALYEKHDFLSQNSLNTAFQKLDNESFLDLCNFIKR